MKTNMGTADRVIRIGIACLVSGVYFSGLIHGTTAIILLGLSAVFVLTSFIRICPLYLPFGISTLRKKKSDYK
jgi:hypothetical protein